ncbi:MAG TPA: DUF5715 family protein [Terriglobales bacterium]|nr:DUF5715 family protein [Terriglobales bacterium]
MQKLRPAIALLFVFAVTAASSGLDSAVNSLTRSRTTHRTHHRRGALWNPMFRPSHESMVRQNEEVDRLELPRIQDEEELNELKANHSLVPIQASEYVRFDPRLDPDRRYCRPWTNRFVQDLGEAFYKQFHNSIQVNSAVRTVQVQKKLRRHNRNAAAEKGELASSHLAGITVDIQRRGLSREQIRWVEEYMLPLKNMGLIEPEEERHQWVFHVMVSDRYTEWRDGDTVAGDEQTEPPQPELQEELSRESQIIKSFILGAQ